MLVNFLFHWLFWIGDWFVVLHLAVYGIEYVIIQLPLASKLPSDLGKPTSNSNTYYMTTTANLYYVMFAATFDGITTIIVNS